MDNHFISTNKFSRKYDYKYLNEICGCCGYELGYHIGMVHKCLEMKFRKSGEFVYKSLKKKDELCIVCKEPLKNHSFIGKRCPRPEGVKTKYEVISCE